MKSNRKQIERAIALVAVLLCTVASGCTGKGSEGGGPAPRGTPSGLPAAAPRALGPGAASMEVPSISAPPPSTDDEDPFAPFADPPEGGIVHPPSEPLPL